MEHFHLNMNETREPYNSEDLQKALQTKTLVELCQDAINIQNASNIQGLATSFPKVLKDLSNYTDDIRNHPVTQLWTSKLHHLANMTTLENYGYVKALEQCQEIANINL